MQPIDVVLVVILVALPAATVTAFVDVARTPPPNFATHRIGKGQTLWLIAITGVGGALWWWIRQRRRVRSVRGAD